MNRTRLTERLQYYIQSHQNDDAKWLLRRLIPRLQSSRSRNLDDILGRLLLHAIPFNNCKMIQHLIGLGVDVDYLHNYCKTPLMVAVNFAFAPAVIIVLLKANANLDALNPVTGMTVLQQIFDSSPSKFPLLMTHELAKLILTRVKAGNDDIEALTDKLIAAGCTLYHAAYFKNLQIIECILDRGIDIDSKFTSKRMTILHAAAAMHDSKLVNWLLDRGADIDALDIDLNSPLLKAVFSRDVMRILLERGADPNISNCYGRTIVSEVLLSHLDYDTDRLQLAFDYGAIPQKFLIHSYHRHPTLEIAFSQKNYLKIDMLIDYLTVLKLSENPVVESFLRYNENIQDFAVVRRRLELCEENLKCKRFETLSMLELLTDGERKMRVHARNKSLVMEVLKFCLCGENKKMFPYYCFTLDRRISRIARLVKLEDAVISIVCEMINGNYNECYVPARNIVRYLNENDLKMFENMGHSDMF